MERSLIACTVESVRVHSESGHHVVLLQEIGPARRLLPIWISAEQAQSIAMSLAGVASARPLTHDLMLATLERLQAKLGHVVVKDLVVDESGNGVFHASIFVTSAAGTTEIDARPSDAVALAVRTTAPVFVAEGVFVRSGIGGGAARDEDLAVFQRFIETLPDDPEGTSAPS